MALVTKTYSFTGANQTFTVPAGVTSIIIKAWGGGGGTGKSANIQGTGGAVDIVLVSF